MNHRSVNSGQRSGYGQNNFGGTSQRYASGGQWPGGGGSSYGTQQQQQYGRPYAGSSSYRSSQNNYYDPQPATRRQANNYAPQPAPQRQQQPVRRINTPQDYNNQRGWQQPSQIAVDDDSDFESPDFRGSSLRPNAAARPPAAKPTSFKSAENSLCLVPQSPSVMEITRLLKGDKGDRGEAGDTFFETVKEDSSTAKLAKASNLKIPGRLMVSYLDIANPTGPCTLAGGEGTTGEDGQLTIQLPRDVKGMWSASNAKAFFTPRQAASSFYVPKDGFDPEKNQFTVHCADKQRVNFDWLFVKV